MISLSSLGQKVLLIGAFFLIAACSKDDTPSLPETGLNPPIFLDCDFFERGGAKILIDNPDAPVDYVVTCRMFVKEDVTIEPGVVIEFQKGTGLQIKEGGSLSAIGEESKPIIFRGTERTKGHWDGIFFDGSKSVKNKLTYVEVTDGGGYEFPNGHQGGVMVYAYSRLEMTNSTLDNNLKYAFNCHSADFKATVVQNNTFSGSEYPALINTDNLDGFKNNSTINNEQKMILVYPTQLKGGDITWHKADVKYRLTDNGKYNLYNQLTIAPGVQIEFPEYGKINLDRAGKLRCVGTQEEPIVLTGVNKTAGSWNGVFIDGERMNEIAFTEIEYSGSDFPAANIYLWYDAKLYIHDVTFRSISGCAINSKKKSDGSHVPNPNLHIAVENIILDPGTCLEDGW